MSDGDISELTGLPELSEPYYWSIYTESLYGGAKYVHLEIRRVNEPRTKFWEKLAGKFFYSSPYETVAGKSISLNKWAKTFIDQNGEAPTEDALRVYIRTFAWELYDEHKSAIAAMSLHRFARDTLAGDYPPKKL